MERKRERENERDREKVGRQPASFESLSTVFEVSEDEDLERSRIIQSQYPSEIDATFCPQFPF